MKENKNHVFSRTNTLMTSVFVWFALTAHGQQAPVFTQAALPYAFAALEPHIDALTMEIHYSRHHAAYTKNLNDALQALTVPVPSSVEAIMKQVSKYPAAVRNNAGGYYNHNLFWLVMSPDGGGAPSGKPAEAIRRDFGSFDAFKEAFSKAAATHFGSGWVWLVSDKGKLTITSTPNQDNPLMDIAGVKGTPVLCIDVWEHAYYLKYQNRRSDYIQAFWNVVNWKQVEILYDNSL
ncbi:MAG: superoxide dismutase [Bacteroidales bacterium]|jgi:Fe-Mn family superoxide dismutase|nr:superoxide dismutase [Bacteroidales bacterium]